MLEAPHLLPVAQTLRDPAHLLGCSGAEHLDPKGARGKGEVTVMSRGMVRSRRGRDGLREDRRNRALRPRAILAQSDPVVRRGCAGGLPAVERNRRALTRAPQRTVDELDPADDAKVAG